MEKTETPHLIALATTDDSTCLICAGLLLDPVLFYLREHPPPYLRGVYVPVKKKLSGKKRAHFVLQKAP